MKVREWLTVINIVSEEMGRERMCCRVDHVEDKLMRNVTLITLSNNNVDYLYNENLYDDQIMSYLI